VYLSLSTKRLPEVVGDPDSGKTGVAAEGMARFLVEDRFRGTVTYYDGEDGAAVRAVAELRVLFRGAVRGARRTWSSTQSPMPNAPAPPAAASIIS
jgi:hypothetical protein